MPWTLPPCTCPRDDSGDTRGCEKHDSRSEWNTAREFYCEGVPCESCGEPTDTRYYHAESDLWIGDQCTCSMPNQPICPELVPLIAQCTSVRELLATCNAHRSSCTKCGEPVEMPVRKESEQGPAEFRQKEAA